MEATLPTPISTGRLAPGKAATRLESLRGSRRRPSLNSAPEMPARRISNERASLLFQTLLFQNRRPRSSANFGRVGPVGQGSGLPVTDLGSIALSLARPRMNQEQPSLRIC